MKPLYPIPDPLRDPVDAATAAFLHARIAMSDGEFGRACEQVLACMKQLTAAHRACAKLRAQNERDA